MSSNENTQNNQANTPQNSGNRNQPPRTAVTPQPVARGVAQPIAETYVAGITNVTADQRALLAILDEINGMDAYNIESIAVGVVMRKQYLVLPQDIVLDTVTTSEFGKVRIHLSIIDKAQIYALNKTACPDGGDAIRFALIRLHAIELGWFNGQKEVRYEAPLTNAMDIFKEDLPSISELFELSRRIAFLLPMFAENVFLTTGHHFLSGDSSRYIEKYSSLAKSTMSSGIIGFMRAEDMYHACLHWISPSRVRNIIHDMINGNNECLPDAVKIRHNAAPAGTALVATTAAVLDSMSSSGIYQALDNLKVCDLKEIIAVKELVKATPEKFHKSSFAYNAQPASREDLARLDRAKEEAAKIAPLCQAFINALLKNAALSRAQALKKHAEANPTQLLLATKYFRDLARKKVSSFEGLYETVVHPDE